MGKILQKSFLWEIGWMMTGKEEKHRRDKGKTGKEGGVHIVYKKEIG